MILILIINGCNTTQELDPEVILLKFKDGATFCEGSHRVYKRGLRVRKNRVGYWKFYYPNGKLEILAEYDNYGELLNSKNYNMDGKLIQSQNFTEDTITTIEYFINGNIKDESIFTIEVENKNGSNFEIYYEKYSEFYNNGQIRGQKEYIDDILHGDAKIWSEDGQLILEYKYDNGLIVVDGVKKN